MNSYTGECQTGLKQRWIVLDGTMRHHHQLWVVRRNSFRLHGIISERNCDEATGIPLKVRDMVEKASVEGLPAGSPWDGIVLPMYCILERNRPGKEERQPHRCAYVNACI